MSLIDRNVAMLTQKKMHIAIIYSASNHQIMLSWQFPRLVHLDPYSHTRGLWACRRSHRCERWNSGIIALPGPRGFFPFVSTYFSEFVFLHLCTFSAQEESVLGSVVCFDFFFVFF